MNVRSILTSKNAPTCKRNPKLIHTMKTSLRRIIPVGALGIALTISSCVSPYYGAYGPAPRNGAVIGALGGGAVGGIIGNQSGRGLEGAAIGAVLGTLAGSALNSGGYGRPYGYNSGYSRPYYGSSYGGGYGYRPMRYSSISIGSGFGGYGCSPFGGYGGGYGGSPFGGYGGGYGHHCR